MTNRKSDECISESPGSISMNLSLAMMCILMKTSVDYFMASSVSYYAWSNVSSQLPSVKAAENPSLSPLKI